MGVLKVHDLMRISCGLCLVPVELNLLVLLMFAVHKTQMGQSKCFQCLSVSVLPWDDGCNSTSRCCRGSSLSLCQSLDTDDKIASFFFSPQIQRSASLTWDVRRPGWTTSLCASTWSLMNMSSCHRRLLRPGVSAPTNTSWNTAARTLSTYAFACTPSMSTASIKCCRVLELIGVFCLPSSTDWVSSLFLCLF